MAKISDLIKELQAVKDVHGDLQVLVEDSYGFQGDASFDIDDGTLLISAGEGEMGNENV